MDIGKLKYLIREIKRNYKRYIGERKDGQSTLVDVVKNFGIDLDESRIEDYIINKIDFEKPSIKLTDTKTNITYKAEYTRNADLLNYYGDLDFIDITVESPEFKIKSLKYIESKEEIASYIKFSKGDYNLIFEKEIANNIGFGMSGKKSTIIYTKSIPTKSQITKEQILLTKTYKDKENNNDFSQVQTYSPQRLINYGDVQDKYYYKINNNIIYGANDCKINDKLHYLYGICFESTDVDINEYLPYNMYSSNLANEIIKQKSQSSILYKGGTDYGTHHTIKIDKIENNIVIDYEAIRWLNFKNPDGSPAINKDVLESKVVSIPVIEKEKITSLEIHSIIDEIKKIGNIFIKMVIDELKTFSKYIDIRNKEKEDINDDLNPKIFIDKSFKEIYDLVKENKDYYFDLISNQFYDATHILETKEKEKILEKQQ